MDKVSDALINLLAVSTGCKTPSVVELSQSEWEKLYSDAVAHQIHLIIFTEANKYGGNVCPDLFAKWKNNTIIQVLSYHERFNAVKEILIELENKGVPFMVLKGLHYKYLYKDPDMRTMSDIDLLTTKDSLEQAVDVIRSFGYINVKEEDPKHFLFVKKNSLPIELHFSLFTEAKRKIASNFNKDIWESAYYFERDGIRFLVPSKTNQIIYCCIHMTNHFGEGGFGLRQLSDFNLLVRHSGKDINWDQLLSKARLYGIGKFVEVMLIICHELFSLSIPDTITNQYKDQNEYVNSMINILLDAGAFGRKDEKAHTNRIIASYISESGSGFLSRFSYIFPSRERLSAFYPYVKKCGLLLPVAWIHRLVRHLLEKNISFADKIPDTKAVNEYAKVFKWLDIKKNIG